MPTSNSEQTHYQAAHQAAPRPASIYAKPVYDGASTRAVYGPALPPTLWLFPLAVLGGLVLLAALIARFRRSFPAQTRPEAILSYTAASSLLTDTERQFWSALRPVVGARAHVLMKVRQADILKHDRRDMRAFGKVSQKHVDFLLCHPETLKPLVAVELDDRSHGRADRKARDVFVDGAFASAGLPIVHVPVAGRYEARELEALLGRHLPARPTEALTNRPGL